MVHLFSTVGYAMYYITDINVLYYRYQSDDHKAAIFE